jgi:hypothetical protein
MIVRSKTIPLACKLEDGDTAKYVQAKVYTTAGVLVDTVNLAHAALGNYVGSYAYAGADAAVLVDYKVFSDAGFTTPDTTHGWPSEIVTFDDSAVAGDQMQLEAATVTAVAEASGTDAASKILATPANLLATNASGEVTIDVDLSELEEDVEAILAHLEVMNGEYDFKLNTTPNKFTVYEKGTSTIVEQYDATLDANGRLTDLEFVDV